ncbi:hypothetical protein HN51_048037 [Arachis hypogaea]|uniref:Serine carboxypeptidase-like n=1 Tax=Arachis hypogaea TaxID=3818 RepID=A0A445AJ95_ARAHY|nr:serine carboxypeptidase-like 11 [Arachis ipaensis]XP_025633475.1 serine carboxypeptidase-like 11 [Arachis hypogaea]QHO24498.1 Serine carboxypeptidase-like [Arachis hypogaea]RYR26519.1 hypothetical protein Ahy_B02g060769 [Arachis hypogaea]
MKMASNSKKWSYFFQLLLLSLTLFLQIASHKIEAGGSKVEYLPGFDGPLPFQLETGYVGLGDSEDDMQVFYYFVKSENDPKNDPLLLWLTGGPGCSSISGFVFQIGPVQFKVEEFDGSLPKLIYRASSWTKVANVIFVDLPMGTGFSYAKDVLSQRSDWKLVHHAHQFIRKWLTENPEYISNEFYMAADSYSGIPAPPLVQEIANGNEKGLQPQINLQGYILGNPVTTSEEGNDHIQYAHGMALISDELYLSLKRNCKGDYLNINPENTLCLSDMEYYNKCLEKIDPYFILNPYCNDDWLKQDQGMQTRSLARKLEARFETPLIVPDIGCENFLFFLVTQWANHRSVRKALHIREGTIGEWVRCYKDDYEFSIVNSVPFHANLSAKGYRSLIFSGDHDAVVPFFSTQAWIRSLNYSIVDDWRPWYLNDQVAGYTRTYSNKMTFATVKGAGHTAAELKPNESYVMFTRWISNRPL